MSVHAQVGEMFPPLELVQRMGDCTQPNFQLLAKDSGRQGAAHSSEIIHVGVRMAEFDVRYRGNLSQGEQETVLRRLAGEVEKHFEWRIARTTFDEDTHAFCYPYLGNPVGSVVFCRLEVKEYSAADLAQKAGFEASGFPQA